MLKRVPEDCTVLLEKEIPEDIPSEISREAICRRALYTHVMLAKDDLCCFSASSNIFNAWHKFSD